MISSLVDKLNKSADEWNGSNMFELAHMCREAADTILQLRDDLQQAHAATDEAEHDDSVAWDRVRAAEAENAKLREEVVDLQKSSQTYESENAKLRERLSVAEENERLFMAENDRLRKRVHELELENAKMRELCADMLVYVAYPYVCVRPDVLVERARELGIEVDG